MRNADEKAVAVLRGSRRPDAEQEKRFAEFLLRTYGREIPLTFEEDKMLNGFTLTVGTDVYDWSLKSRLRQFEEKLKALKSGSDSVIPLMKEAVEDFFSTYNGSNPQAETSIKAATGIIFLFLQNNVYNPIWYNNDFFRFGFSQLTGNIIKQLGCGNNLFFVAVAFNFYGSAHFSVNLDGNCNRIVFCQFGIAFRPAFFDNQCIVSQPRPHFFGDMRRKRGNEL